MLIRALNKDDIPSWLALAHEYKNEMKKLTPDVENVYKGFDTYMAAKISKNEAFAAVEALNGKFLGVVSFSKENNRISFLGISKGADFAEIGTKLMETAMGQLDHTKDITVNVFKSDAEIFQQERALYENFGFIASDEIIMESGIPAYQMKKFPACKMM